MAGGRALGERCVPCYASDGRAAASAAQGLRHPPPSPPRLSAHGILARAAAAWRARHGIALAACCASCGEAHPELRLASAPRDANPIVVGALGDLGGADGPRRAALELELEQLNARGGAKGRPVRLLCYDDQGRPDGLSRALDRLVREDKVVALFVLSGVERTEAAQRDAAGAPVLAWAPAPASDLAHARSLGEVDSKRCAAELVAWLARARTYDKQDLVDAIDGPPPLPDYSIKPPPPKTAPNADPTTPKPQ
jgi:hypothetical protein